jgi:microcystin-dependent protein
VSYLKISSNLFIGLPELRYLNEALDTEGFRAFIRQNSSTFGLINNPASDEDFDNGKVQQGTNSGTIKIAPIFAIDNNGLFIRAKAIDLIPVLSSPTQWYWVKIKHKYSNLESGTVSVSTNGALTGSGTFFRSKLRGQPNYPSKISFPLSSTNAQEYTVISVIDDQNAIIAGSLAAQSNLQYAVVGTFTPGVPVPTEDKFPFQKDDYELTLVAEASLGVEPAKNSGEYWLARVRNNSGSILIEDKRNEIWTSADSFNLKSRFSTNKFIGVEAIKWTNEFDTRDKNIIEIGWGLRTSNHTFSSTLRQITISNGEGGRFKKDTITTPFTNGDFDGWRLYFKNGKYAIITDSVIDAGAIKITLDKIDPSDYNSADQLFICPDVEEVIIRFRNDVANDDISLYDEEVAFPVNTQKCVLKILVPSATTYSYNLNYRHKNNNQYSEFLAFPNSSFYTESSFDEDGNLKTNPVDRTLLSYTGNQNNGYIRFTSNPNSYYKTILKVDKGDRYGVRFREMSNASPLISLRVGDDEFNQQIQNLGPLNMSVNQIINLRTDGAKNGSEFFLYIKGPFVTSNGDYAIQFRQNYVSVGNPGTLLFEVDNGSMTNGNIVIFCTHSLTQGWVVNHVNAGSSGNDVGEVKMYIGSLTGKFDNTGLGISSNWFGWALCNGQNGTPDLRGRFAVGMDPTNVDYQMAAIGGAASVSLTEAQLPEHRHFIIVSPATTNTAGFDFGQALAQTRSSGGDSNANLGGVNADANVGLTSKTGNNQAHENRPPYYAMAFAIKILNV